MKKFLVMVPALALMMSASVFANDGAINNTTLQAMGLSGMSVMSDQAALSVRGMGYQPKSSKSSVMAYGHSYAGVGSYGAGAGTEDGYKATGSHKAGGEHYSYAGKDYTTTEVIKVNGNVKKTTTSKSVYVYAGGYSNAYAF